MDYILTEIRKALEENIEERNLLNTEKFFKEKVKVYGVGIPIVNKISKDFFEKIKNRSGKEILDLCEELWKSGYNEEQYVACNWSYYLNKDYTPSYFEVFEKWVDLYVNNWASCDTLCNHTVGTFIEMFPDYALKLKEWARSDNRWTKRAAAVTFIIPARKGLFSDVIFDIADILLLDKDDLVQKGYGWMLKALSEAYQTEVFEYIMLNKDIMPRTSLRYAIGKMPKELKERAMAK